MPHDAPSSSRLERISIERTMPGVAIGIAVGFVALFTVSQFSAEYLSASSRSAERAEAVAETIAPDVAWREVGQIEHVLNVQAPHAVVLDEANRIITGNPEALADGRSVTSVPIVYEGDQIGRLVTPPLVPFRPILPPWAIVIFSFSAIGFAYAAARFYAKRIHSNLLDLTDFAASIGSGLAAQPLAVVDFSEIARLRTALKRMGQRIDRQNELLKHAAYRDAQTGLPNAADMMARLRRAGAEATYDRPAAFIHLELEVTAGATIGTPLRGVLAPAVERLNGELDKHFASVSDGAAAYSISRMGPDHLGIILPDAVSRTEVSSVLRALRRAVVAPLEVNGRDVSISLSGGVAMMPEDSDDPDAILDRAELALRKAEKEDLSGFKFYAPRLDRLQEARTKLEMELRSGIAGDEFRAAFQPKISFETGKIVGFEALARWRREGGKVVSPAAFIPLAEETGLIRNIGEAILLQACQKAREWVNEGVEATIAVNVSPLQFEQARFVDVVVETLRQTGLPPRLLELEITETMAVSDPQRITEVMRPLRTMGVKLAIDDFGTGHSNLATLSKLPFSTFKIDRQFVSSLDAPGHAPAIVEMILAMAETLNLETVAEGVETQEQAEFLRRRGCTLAQGYLYSPAVPEDDVVAFARQWNLGAQPAQPIKRAIGQI